MANSLLLKLLVALIIALILGEFLGPRQACADELWATANLRAYHFNRAPDYNENNFGLGLEYRPSAHLRYIAGEYENSFRNRSWYAGAAYFSDSWHSMRGGLAAGAVSGYDHPRPLVVPALSVEVGRAEVNVVFFGKANNKDSALIAAQMGVRFW